MSDKEHYFIVPFSLVLSKGCHQVAIKIYLRKEQLEPLFLNLFMFTDPFSE